MDTFLGLTWDHIRLNFKKSGCFWQIPGDAFGSFKHSALLLVSWGQVLSVDMNSFLTLHLLLVGKVLTVGWWGNITGPSSSKSVYSLRLSPGCWHRALFHGWCCCRHVTGLPDSTEDAKLLSPACDTPLPRAAGFSGGQSFSETCSFLNHRPYTKDTGTHLLRYREG